MNIKTSNKIYYLYLVMSVCIIGLHTMNISEFQQTEFILVFNKIVSVFFNMSVSAFFFVSALLMFKTIDNKTYKKTVFSKFKSLLIPYILWNVVCLPLKWFKVVYLENEIFNLSFFDVIKGLYSSEWNPVLWFIRVLFIYILIYPIIFYIIKRKYACISFIILLMAFNIYIGPVEGYSTARYWLPIYMLGAYLGYNHQELVFKPRIFDDKKYIYLISTVLFIILIVYGSFSDLGLYICRMVSPVFVWVLADFLSTEKKPKWWMKQTFYFFCTHLIFAEYIRKLYILIFGNGTISAALSHFILPIVLLLFLAVTAIRFNKLFNKIYIVFIGGR